MRSGKFVGQGQGNNVIYRPNKPHKGARLASVPNRALGALDHFNAKRMAKDVERTVVDIVAEFGARTTDEAILFVADLKKKGRFQQDVY